MTISRDQSTTHSEITCRHCGAIDDPIIERGRWGPHTAKAICRHCGAFVQWLSSRTPAERQARAEHYRREATAKKPVTLDQLGKLESLRWEGTMPANRQEAIELIDDLLRRQEGAA